MTDGQVFLYAIAYAVSAAIAVMTLVVGLENDADWFTGRWYVITLILCLFGAIVIGPIFISADATITQTIQFLGGLTIHTILLFWVAPFRGTGTGES